MYKNIQFCAENGTMSFYFSNDIAPSNCMYWLPITVDPNLISPDSSQI